MDVAIEKDVERFIMISTDKAVNPANAMGASKRLTEIILQSKGNKYKTKFAAVRFWECFRFKWFSYSNFQRTNKKRWANNNNTP